MTAWISIKHRRPSYGEITWGLWRDNEVCLVKYLFFEEFINKGGLDQYAWYCIDYDTDGWVEWWMPLERPKFEENNDKP